MGDFLASSIFSRDEEPYRTFLVVGGPGYGELAVGNKYLLRQELERHIGSIDAELLRLILDWEPTARSMLTFLTSVGSYPSRTKIRALKEALTAPDRYSEENFMRITKILLGSERGWVRSEYGPNDAYLTVVDYEKWVNMRDPIDPDAKGVTRKGIGIEKERRQRWKKAWKEYLLDLKRRSGLLFNFVFLCDLPSGDYGLITISPYLRLPSGEYLAPNGEIVKSPASSGSDVKPIAEDNKDEKGEKKKFPWWVVIVVAIVALFFMTKNK
jgi:hypothetical protein